MLSGLIVHERGLRGAEESVNNAKREIFAGPDPRSRESNAYDVRNGRGDFLGEDRSLDLEKKKGAFSRAVGGTTRSGARWSAP